MAELRTSDFDYDLPEELIAQVPAEERGQSRLLVVRREGGTPGGREEFEERSFASLADLIPAGDLLVLNSTRVRHARLAGRRPAGGPAEVLLIHPAEGETWVAMGKPASAMRPGKRILLEEGIEVETLEILDQGFRRVRFLGGSAEEAMQRSGRIPLPPYIAREATPEDEVRYQTVYAEREGSVAAPTAGLHFTPALLDGLTARGVLVERLDLEVGPGTFKPVDTEDLASHPMHPERYEIPVSLADAVARTRVAGGAVWAVGTTVVRALESAALATGELTPGAASTRLMITPGFTFRVVNRLITNFHLPRSTLLMLVSAFAGHQRTLEAYRFAVAARFRFYSYGDAMVVL